MKYRIVKEEETFGNGDVNTYYKIQVRFLYLWFNYRFKEYIHMYYDFIRGFHGYTIIVKWSFKSYERAFE